MNEDSLNKIDDLINKSRTILVSGHKNPDGDSMASSLAMAHFLKGLGKEVTVFSGDKLPYNYMFLENSSEITSDLPQYDPDLFFIVDAGSVDRIESKLRKKILAGEKPRVLFDHHVLTNSVKEFYTEIFVDEKACATAALIFRWAEKRGLNP